MSPRIVVPALIGALLLLGIAASFLLRGDGEAGRARRAGPLAQAPRDVGAPPAADLAAPGRESTPEAAPLERAAVPEGAPREERGEREPEAGGVRGRVVDRYGSPVAGAEVLASSGFLGALALVEAAGLSGQALVRAQSDEQGEFVLEGLTPGTFRVAVRAAGFAPFEKASLSLPAGVEEHRLDPFVLSLGAILEGRVVDAGGRGVEGARLIPLLAEDGPFFFDRRRRRPAATTAADGSFRVDQLACGPYRMLVMTEEHPDATFEGLAERPGEVVGGLLVRLAPGDAIAGRVEGVPAEELAGLEVRAWRATAETEGGGFSIGPYFGGRSADVADDGSFVVRGLEPGQEYELQARGGRGEEFFMGRARSQRVRARAGDRDVVLRYQPGATIRFQVLDEETGGPLEQFTVEAGITWPQPLRGPDGEPLRHHPEGRVVVDDLRPGAPDDGATVRIEAVGYRTLELADLRVANGEDLDLGKLVLERVPVVRVTVVDRGTGAPIAGARVRLEEAPEEGMVRLEHRISIGDGPEGGDFGEEGSSALTDETGLAVLTSLPGRTCRIEARAEGYALGTIEQLFLPQESGVDQRLQLDRGGRVVVRVVDPSGGPVAGVQVGHRGPSELATGSFSLDLSGSRPVTAADGRLAFENLAAGEHAFRLDEDGPGGVLAGGGGTFVVRGIPGMEPEDDWTRATVVEGETTEVTLHAKARALVHGRVREAGKLLAGASVSVAEAQEGEGEQRRMGFAFPGFGGGPTVRTDGDGEYRIEDLRVGRYTLTVEHATRRMPTTFQLDVREGENRFDVELSVAVVEGRVTDAEGQPVAGAVIGVERRQGSDGQVSFRSVIMIADDAGDAVMHSGGELGGPETRTDAEGRYSLRGVLPDVELVVTARGGDAQPARSEPFVVDPDEVERGVDLVLEAGGSLLVEARLPDGSPARMCMVTATYEGEGEVDPQNGFIQSGSTTLKGLRPGPWRVGVRRLGPEGGSEAPEDRTVEVVALQTATTSFDLR